MSNKKLLVKKMVEKYSNNQISTFARTRENNLSTIINREADQEPNGVVSRLPYLNCLNDTSQQLVDIIRHEFLRHTD